MEKWKGPGTVYYIMSRCNQKVFRTKRRGLVLFKQLEEEKVDGFSDQYAETTCKTRESSLHSRFCLIALEKNQDFVS